jgi:heme-degrading monooxygenase HmoA
MIAKTPNPPYYAVIFTSLRTEVEQGYSAMSDKMEELAKKQPEFLGMESSRDGLGITISYWKSLEAIKEWKNNSQHLVAQELGKKQWYKSFKTRICKVELDYEFNQ